MAQTIQFRRGNNQNLPVLAPGEPAITLDTKDVYVGSSSGNIKLPKVLQQETEPTTASEGTLWLDTSDNAYQGTVFEELNTQLAQKATEIENLNSYTIKLLSPTFLFDGSDETSKLQAIIDQYVNWDRRVTIEFPNNKTIKLDGLIMGGRIIVKGNGCYINGNGGYLFANRPTTGAILTISDLTLNNVGLANFEMTSSIGSSLRVKANNITGYGGTDVAPTSTFYRGASNDFLDFQNISLYYYDHAFKIEYDSSIHRMNTQLRFSSIDIHYCRTGFYLKGVDKVTLDNIDMQRVGIGVRLGQYSRRMNLRAVHVENFGNYTDITGYGFYVENTNQIVGIELNQCSFMLPGSNATNAINIVAITSGSAVVEYMPRIKFNDVYIEPKVGATDVVLNGFWEWNSKVDGITIVFNNSTSRIISGTVNPTYSGYSFSKNLLKSSEIVDSTSFDSFPAGLVISTVGYLKQINNPTAGELTAQFSFTVQENGWYSLMFNGDFSSMSSGIRVQQAASPFTNYKVAKCYNANNNKTNRLYFNVADATRTINVKFDIAAGDSLYINNVGLYRGFKANF